MIQRDRVTPVELFVRLKLVNEWSSDFGVARGVRREDGAVIIPCDEYANKRSGSDRKTKSFCFVTEKHDLGLAG